MEIVHIILGKANPERMNGVNRVVYEMATSQVQYGYSVQVWGISKSEIHDYPERNFKTKLYKKYTWPFFADPELLKDLSEKRNTIVVHIHGAFIPLFYTIAMFLHKKGIPYVITPHSSYNAVMMKKNSFIKKIYFGFFEKRLLNRAGMIHLLGKTEWDGMEIIYNNSKSELIPYGFTSSNQQLADSLKKELFTVCYCGRLSIYTKGLDILLGGFAMFNKQYPDSQLIIIGDGKERAILEEMRNDLMLQATVHIKGSVFGTEKVRIISSSHVFAHPSRTDGIPVTIVEAASLGLPCIVSEATNMGSYITGFDAGILMEENTPEKLCEGLMILKDRLLNKEGARQLKDHSLRMIHDVFNWKDILIRFNNIYEEQFTGYKKVPDNSPKGRFEKRIFIKS